MTGYWAEYPEGFTNDKIARKVTYGITPEDINDPYSLDLRASYFLPEDLELIQ